MSNDSTVGLKNYYPLIVIITLITLASVALQIDAGVWDIMTLMRHFMGLFFIIFSLFKLINIAGFQKGFLMYDVVTKRYPSYGYLYPFIELALGLAYLSNLFPLATNGITCAVMAISSIGVIKSIKEGMNLKCVCLGTILNVPLSTVSVIENIGMGLMAAGMMVMEL